MVTATVSLHTLTDNRADRVTHTYYTHRQTSMYYRHRHTDTHTDTHTHTHWHAHTHTHRHTHTLTHTHSHTHTHTHTPLLLLCGGIKEEGCVCGRSCRACGRTSSFCCCLM